MKITQFASGSSGNCYLLDNGNSQLMLECGITIKKIKEHMNFNFSKLKGCLVTHEHQDHSKSMEELTKFGINIYASSGTFYDSININYKTIKAHSKFNIDEWEIYPFDTVHDCKEPLGFLIRSLEETLLFVTDTKYIKYKFKNLNYIMIECNHSYELVIENKNMSFSQKKRTLESHFSIDNVLEFLKSNDLSNVEQINLLHFSDRNSDKQDFLNKVKKLTGKIVV
ncbi:MAG: MBL fold metallo-hydrolase [Clostridium sp.]